MGNANNAIDSLDELDEGDEVTFWRPVGGQMYKQDTGTVTGFGELPRPHAVIEFDGDNSPLAIGPEDIESN